MPFTRLTKDMNIISKLDDEPNDVGGLTAAELKAEFDKAGNAVKDWINTVLLPSLESEGGAGSIGISTVSGLTGALTVQAALEKVVTQMKEITQGAVADGSINAQKLADGAVTAEKLAALAVAAEALAEGAVTAEKIAPGAVTGEKLAAASVGGAALADGSVTTAKLADKSVTTAKLADKSVTTAKLADNAVGTEQIDVLAVTTAKLFHLAVTTEKLANGAVTVEKIADKAALLTALFTGKVILPYSNADLIGTALPSAGTPGRIYLKKVT